MGTSIPPTPDAASASEHLERLEVLQRVLKDAQQERTDHKPPVMLSVLSIVLTAVGVVLFVLAVCVATGLQAPVMQDLFSVLAVFESGGAN